MADRCKVTPKLVSDFEAWLDQEMSQSIRRATQELYWWDIPEYARGRIKEWLEAAYEEGFQHGRGVERQDLLAEDKRDDLSRVRSTCAR